MSSITAQYIAVGLALAWAVAWIVRRVIRRHRCKNNECGCATSRNSMCDGCGLADHCRSKNGH